MIFIIVLERKLTIYVSALQQMSLIAKEVSVQLYARKYEGFNFVFSMWKWCQLEGWCTWSKMHFQDFRKITHIWLCHLTWRSTTSVLKAQGVRMIFSSDSETAKCLSQNVRVLLWVQAPHQVTKWVQSLAEWLSDLGQRYSLLKNLSKLDKFICKAQYQI